MKGHAWKPGDVAMVTEYGVPTPAVWAENCGRPKHFARGHWCYLVTLDGATWTSNPDAQAHPLVVIDPEDAEQVERLSRAVDVASGWTHFAKERADAMRVALREFADQRPQIEEPQGLGAVVRDAKGKVWVRDAAYRDRWFNSGDGKRADFDQIDAVEVLSEGWSE